MNPTCTITSYDVSMAHEELYLVNLSWGELHDALSSQLPGSFQFYSVLSEDQHAENPYLRIT